jgi:hypothetical protein
MWSTEYIVEKDLGSLHIGCSSYSISEQCSPCVSSQETWSSSWGNNKKNHKTGFGNFSGPVSSRMAIFPRCTCGGDNEERVYRVGKGLFVSTGSGGQYIKKLKKSQERKPNFQHWKVSTQYNANVQISSHKSREWYIGLPRMIFPSLARLRSFLTAIPQDSFISGTMWVMIEVSGPDYIVNDLLYLIVSLVMFRQTLLPNPPEVYQDARDFLDSCVPSAPVERYLREAQLYLSNRQSGGNGSQISSHIVLRSLIYNRGFDGVLMDPSRPMPQMRVLVTVCNSRVGQLDQSYFSSLSPNGGLIQINQSVNASDEILISIYVGNDLVSRFQTLGMALMEGPLRLTAATLGNTGIYVNVPESFYFELFSECLQWIGGTTISDASEQVLDESPRHHVAHRLRPSNGTELSKEEKFVIVMSALPSYPYRQMAQQDGESDEDFILRTQCQICLEDYHENEPVRVLPCMHVFHGACAEDWLQVRLQCPNCCADIVEMLANAGDGSGRNDS